MSDIYGAPATRYRAVTPSDTTVVNCRKIYVGTTGTLVLQSHDGATTVTFSAVPVGILDVSAYRIYAASTATNIVALY